MCPQYFVLLLCIFLLEILAGILAYIYYQQLNEELKQNLRETMTQKYQQSSHEHITRAVDKLQQEFKCCGSNSSSDWEASVWIRSIYAKGRKVPDSCCKTPTELCGLRDHPSNIYKVEGGCITKLEKFILDHLKIIGAVGVGIACVQVSIELCPFNRHRDGVYMLPISQSKGRAVLGEAAEEEEEEQCVDEGGNFITACHTQIAHRFFFFALQIWQAITFHI
ncbi:hypothetical protein FQN60_011047 [Etheostoma spectabile]|uniref:Tetraspanin n=1 Tax=Etheostoma spectabile TaxID=54343 RepID=A0A5J5DQY8_9PERO|nr:hypothetical protein FQN60_011047 [Etheostoma spectabile]